MQGSNQSTVAVSGQQVHRFEEAGLGRAPFRFVGIETANDRAAVQTERASNGMIYTTNYATSCDYCGQGIQNAFQVRSADGKQFKVGCDCIRKTGDAGLIRHVTDEERSKRAKATAARNLAKSQREAALVAAFRAGKCESLHGQPHPKGRQGTAHDYVAWCVDNRCYGAAILGMIEDSLTKGGNS
jgi:hypothetical protein